MNFFLVILIYINYIVPSFCLLYQGFALILMSCSDGLTFMINLYLELGPKNSMYLEMVIMQMNSLWIYKDLMRMLVNMLESYYLNQEKKYIVQRA